MKWLKLINLISVFFIILELIIFVFLIYKIGFFLNELSENPTSSQFEGYDFKKYEVLIKYFE